MTSVVKGPGAFTRLDHVWVPLPDGIRLGARIWLPEDAPSSPVPAILEYVPYRKNDLFAVNDEGRFAYFAAHGYAGVRLDVRGSGDSEGVLVDEYAGEEQQDALGAIDWIASQPWCSGAVGMIGKSWGGFNGLQVAAKAPPQLKAVVTVYSTDDRYADDAHYMGGCLLTDEMLSWGTNMHTVATLPPDPVSVGEDWKAMWQERLEAFHPQLHTWLEHQRRDAYWKHGSVCESFGDITCAVYAVGGWCDGYRDPVLRLMEGLACPKKALIGPWSHQYAMEDFEPGPHIGFLQECIRFFDHFLKGVENSIMDEPMVRAYIQDPVRPAAHHPERPGHWAAEPSWPSPNITGRRLHLNSSALGAEPAPEQVLCIVGSQLAGLDAGSWCAFGGPLDAPPDQRVEDGLSLTFTSAPLTESIEILGNPVADIVVSVDKPVALVVVRLCDVFEDGQSALITRGLLNLTHRAGHENPEPLRPGERTPVRVVLQSIGQSVPAGHRLRVAISPTYFPWAWPSPEAVRLSLYTGASTIELPLRGASPLDGSLRAFGPPEIAPKLPHEVTKRLSGAQTLTKDPLSGRVEVVQDEHGSRVRLAGGLEMEESGSSRYSITEGEPLSASCSVDHAVSFGRDGFEARLTARNELSSDAESFHLRATIDAFDGDDHFFEREWTFEIPRDRV
ncbi:MAG: CocE/NonD family hydrolase [Acidimicrobiales bacterium]